MQWLVRLVTPAGGLVLDPFCGSGSSLIAADREGFDAIGIDSDPHAAEITRRRLNDDAGPMFSPLEGWGATATPSDAMTKQEAPFEADSSDWPGAVAPPPDVGPTALGAASPAIPDRPEAAESGAPTLPAAPADLAGSR